MPKLVILMTERFDSDSIDDIIGKDADFPIEIHQSYSDSTELITLVQLRDVSPSFTNAIKSIYDAATWQLEKTESKVIVVERLSGYYNLSGSYVRVDESLTENESIPDGTAIHVVITFPGFESSTEYEFDIWYGQAFNPSDVNALLAKGLALTGDGSEFEISSVIPYKIRFSKPEITLEKWVIADPNSNNIESSV